MNELVGSGIALLVLAAVVGLAIRSLWRSHKAGGHCSGGCGSCGGCSHCK